ncbi:uncharacterized protein LOC120091153 isoform X1 [Benincasa hispida]|uniref:uncharacterized protein LOC120091153 isoform X1 n=1 Tax=Benincasa hispida TaxID=102211 RepID=UPI0018FFACC3|nr:uncharacterized protein LOC120091153 isoform X1 [Benincasa hispida]
MTTPPSLLSLTIHSAIHNLSRISDLSFLPDHIVLDLFLQETLRAGKLNERILKLFVASGKDEVLLLIEAFNIQQVVTPVLPTRCSEKF